MSVGTGSASFQFDLAAKGGHGGTSIGSGSFQFNGAAKSTVIEIYESQQPLQTDANFDDTLEARTSQFLIMSMGTQPAEEIFNSQDVVLSSTQVTAKEMYDSQTPALVLGANPMTDMNTSQVVVMSMVKSNPDRRQMRAFTFYQDGHWFYVLHLGNIGTIVFDTLTRKWSEWQSFNYNNWRANYGLNWNEDILAGSIDSNVVFQVSADTGTDMGTPIISRMTAGYPMRMRGTLVVDEVMLASSVGISAPIGDATFQLRGSDDYGLNWNDYGTLSMTDATPKTQVSWRSLGIITQPGRLFELVDNGAAKRINDLQMFSADEAPANG